MNLGLSLEIASDAYDKASALNKLSKDLESSFQNKEYGSGITDITIGLICVAPEMELFFKSRNKYQKQNKILEYDVKINHDKVLKSSVDEVVNIAKEAILASLHVIDDLQIANFDKTLFADDLRVFFQDYRP